MRRTTSTGGRLYRYQEKELHYSRSTDDSIVDGLFCDYVVEWSDTACRVADSLTRQALSCASVFDRNGKAAGITDGKGRLPYISGDMFPITIVIWAFMKQGLIR